ncbi:hypothetical protein GIB67_001288 [Kingdonia uniflora]|uniref:Uncharacterized protein n=1 Tax=Kingdonia uniflora TaxID=39325 RepID=A0A7J7LLF8_9MAGN|nr:hypothetical protein GIB67_001288 [Kingdonia uniflora]
MNANKKNKKAEEADVPLKKKVEGTKEKVFTDEQFNYVPLIQLKTLILTIPKKGLANRVPRKRRAEFSELENIQSTAKNLLQQVTPGEGLEVVKDLMVDDDVEVNLEVISSEYGGGLLNWKKDDEKDDDDKKYVEEKVKYEEEQPQVAEEEDSEPPTVVVYYNRKKYVQHANETLVVVEIIKTDIVFFNHEEVVGEAYQTTYYLFAVDFSFSSFDLPYLVSLLSFVLALMELEVDVTLKKRHALTDAKINEIAFKMACRMNQLYAQLDKLLSGVLLESFIQMSISQDEKTRRIGKETVCLNALYTLYPKQWLDNEVIDVYSKALIQYFDTQHRTRPDK